MGIPPVGAQKADRLLLSFCCREQYPYEDCNWYYQSSRIWGEIPFWCTGVCSTGRHWLQQIRLGVYQVHFPSTQPIMVSFILTPLTEHGPSGYGYYCCNPPNANCPREKVWSVRIGEPNWDDDDDWLVEVTRPLNCLLASSGRQLLKWIIDDSGALVRDMHIMVPDRSVTQGKWFDPDEFNSRRFMRKIITICSQKKLLMSEAKRLISCSWDARQGLLLRCASVGSHY